MSGKQLQKEDVSQTLKATFPKLLKKLADAMQANQNKNLKSGFKKCGIAPYNPDAVLDRLPKQPDETENQDEQNTSDIVDSSFKSILKEMRGLDAPETRKWNKRLKVPPGKSVAHHSEEAQQSENNQEDGIEVNKTTIKFPTQITTRKAC